MERIEATCGYREIDDCGKVTYYGGRTEDGFAYKDDKAYESGVGVCYVSEYGLDEQEGETRQSIFDMVREAIQDNDLPVYAEFVKSIADDLYYNADWAYISTYLDQMDLFAIFYEDYKTEKVCPRCGNTLYRERELDYPYICIECDENFNESEVE